MNYKAKIDSGGRVLIPSQLRKLLQLESGDEVIISEDNGRITLTTTDKKLAAIQAKIAHCVPDNVSLTDELIKLRRSDAEHG